MAEPALSFRPFRAVHFSLLHRWLCTPHVARWWGTPPSLADVIDHYGPYVEHAHSVHAYIAYLADAPVGYVQSYTVMGHADGWWPGETDPGARGIDQFIGDAARLNQGLGTLMVRQFCAQLFQDAAVSRIQTDPSPDNHRAIRCYERVGFIAQGRVKTPDGDALLMVLPRAT
jgi:RimJ/RimL family protein N-acetyltransferase